MANGSGGIFKVERTLGRRGGMVSQMKSKQDGLCGEAVIKPQSRKCMG